MRQVHMPAAALQSSASTSSPALLLKDSDRVTDERLVFCCVRALAAHVRTAENGRFDDISR